MLEKKEGEIVIFKCFVGGSGVCVFVCLFFSA